MFVSAQVLGLIENQAVRKFVVYDEDGEDGVAGILVSRSSVNTSKPLNRLL